MKRTLDRILLGSLDVAFPAAQAEIRVGGDLVYEQALGYLDPDSRMQAVTPATRFDLASVSKLFTTTAFMTLIESGTVALDQPVRDVLPEFIGQRLIRPYPDPLQTGQWLQLASEDSPTIDAGRVTFRHLLAHNSGLPPWLPLHAQERVMRETGSDDDAIAAALRDTVFRTHFAYPTGARVAYSDIGLILVGWAVERIAGARLAAIVRQHVTEPPGMTSVSYGLVPCANVAPTEFYPRWGRHMCGEVHDENALALGSVAGHAGLFAAAHDVAALGEMFLRGGFPLLKRETVEEMTRLQAEEDTVRRGIGFALWSPSPQATSNPLSARAFGHLGFTGTSLWMDPARDLVVTVLTNRVYFGRNGEDTMTPFRIAFHQAVADAFAPLTS